MDVRKRVAHLDLAAVLLLVAILELALNRMAVPVLRPPGTRPPPAWHRQLDVAGLYVFHLASVLSLAVAAWAAWAATARRDLLPAAARAALGVTSALFIGLAALTVVSSSPRAATFPLETAFAALLLFLLVSFAVRPGDLRVKLGLLLVTVPFFIHYYGTFTLRVLTPLDAARWSSLPDRVREIGHWSLAACALASPLVFAPGPPRVALARPGPMAAGVFAATVGSVILRKYYDVGMLLAARGLGVELGPAIPGVTIALYVVALGAVAWTIASAIIAESPARRAIGGGFALVVVAGYAFSWPLQLLCAVVGLLLIAEGGTQVGEEERALSSGPAARFHAPPVPTDAWSAYLRSIAEALGAGAPVLRREGDVEEALISGARREQPFVLRVERVAGAVAAVEVTFGAADQADGEPSWVLFARPEGMLSVGAHPSPPPARAPQIRTGDSTFDRRFRIQDAGDLTARLLDDGLRASATAVLDGWLAAWPGRALRYRVCPGRGAPLDHPVPVTELAFRGAAGAQAPEKMVCVVDLLATIAERALARAAG